MGLLTLFILALLSEAIWETLKMIWQKGRISVDRVGALITGVIIAFVTKINIFEIVEISCDYSLIGIIFTGILISRGANFVHDFIENISKVRQNSKYNSVIDSTEEI